MTNRRNHLCWCGSGKKFKKCHWGREKLPSPNPYESGLRYGKLMKPRKCLHPEASPNECMGGIVKAHSIRRAADLLEIAVDGHVRQITIDMAVAMKTGGKSATRLVGVNVASTFTGFCNRHDTTLFAPLETSEFTASDEQCFLLFYRAWSREVYAKEGSLAAASVLKESDRGRPPLVQLEMQAFIRQYVANVALGVRDVRKYKALLDEALNGRGFAGVRSCAVWFTLALPVVCSGAFYPYWDLQGSRLQTFSPQKLSDALAVTLLNENGRGCAVLSWVAAHSTAAEGFVRSLMREENIADALCRTVYSSLDNVYCSPTWWDALTDEQRSELTDRASDNARVWEEGDGKFLLTRGQPLLALEVSSVVNEAVELS
ncbi:MAG: SEC-C domain-containing protein [Gemmatimonadota bacterium]